MLKYPFQESWPIEGFAMDNERHVQIRIVSFLRAVPPVKGYPPIVGTRAYRWWEVRLSFLPGREGSGPDGPFIEIKNKAGRKLKARSVWQCIARFKTEEEAYRFVHHMHQSKNKKHFFPALLDI